MTSSSESEGIRKLPSAYRSRKRRDPSSSSTSSSSSVCSNSSYEGRKKRERRRGRSRRRQKKREKKDKPMWKEEGELSDDRSSSGDSRSRSRERKRGRERRRRHSPGDSRRRPTSYERWRNRRRDQKTFHSKTFKCNECGSKHPSLKTLIHHEMNDHSLNAPCHLCHQKLPTKSKFREHYELEHTSEVVKCTFCKSAFDIPLEMNDRKWEDMASHIYGELLYSRLAEHEEKTGEKSAR